MKEEEKKHHHHHHHHPKRSQLLLYVKRFHTTSVYTLFLVVAFSLGFFASHSLKRVVSKNNGTTVNASEADQVKSRHVAVEPDLYRFSSKCADPVPSKLVRQTILDRVYNGTSPYQDLPPPLLPRKRRRIKGWGSTGAVFETLIRRVQPRTIVELGTFLGASAIHMAELTHKLGLRTQILCIDDFRGWPGFRDKFKYIQIVNGDVLLMHQFMQNVAQSNHSDRVLPVPFSTGSALVSLCEWGIYADLVEVDAGHDFHSAWADINRAHAILSPGGVMFGHDYFTAADNRGVRRAVNLFAKVKGLRVLPHGEHWVLAPR